MGGVISHVRTPILALHGREGSPQAMVARLGLAPAEVVGPSLDSGWLAQPFADQVEAVIDSLANVPAAVGHSWGAWLLLAAACELRARGRAAPPFLLLSALLGIGLHPGGAAIGFIPPRASRIRRFIAAPEVEGGLARRTIFVHGADDTQVPPAAILPLVELGFRCVVVPAGHDLNNTVARDVIRQELLAILAPLPTTEARSPTFGTSSPFGRTGSPTQ